MLILTFKGTQYWVTAFILIISDPKTFLLGERKCMVSPGPFMVSFVLSLLLGEGVQAPSLELIVSLRLLRSNCQAVRCSFNLMRFKELMCYRPFRMNLNSLGEQFVSI